MLVDRRQRAPCKSFEPLDEGGHHAEEAILAGEHGYEKLQERHVRVESWRAKRVKNQTPSASPRAKLESMLCPSCSEETRDGSRRCSKCKAWLCPECQTEVDSADVCCSACGFEFAPMAQPSKAGPPPSKNARAPGEEPSPLARDRRAASESEPPAQAPIRKASPSRRTSSKATQIRFKSGAKYSFPNVCACCLEPTDKQVERSKSVVLPGYLLLGKISTRTLHYSYPLCPKCVGLRDRSENSVPTLPAAILFVAAAIGVYAAVAKGNTDTAQQIALATAVVGGVWYAVQRNQMKKRWEQEQDGHQVCIGGDAVEIVPEQTDAHWIVFSARNADFAHAAAESGTCELV